MKNFDYKALVLSCVDFSGYENSATLKSIYMSEYGNFRGNPCIKDCMSYLQGLPSVCTIPFYNYEIYKLLGADPDKDIDGKLIDQYWYNAGKAFKSILNG